MVDVRATRIGDSLYMIDAWMEEREERLACYLFDTPHRTLIEVGPSATLGHLLAALDALGIDDLAAFVVTHIHLDHAGAAGQMAQRFPRAKVGVHRRGARHLAAPQRLWDSAADVFGEEWLRNTWGPMEPVPEERLLILDEGDQIPLGNGRRLDVLYTPGHAKHHVVFQDSAEGGMFVGDSVGLCYPHGHFVQPVTPPPDFDPDLQIEHLHRMAERDPSFLGFAHFGPEYDARGKLYEAEQRLLEWVQVVRAIPDLDDTAATSHLEAWTRRHFLDLGHTAGEIQAYAEKTNWPMQVAGIRRWLAANDGDSAHP